MWVTTNIAAFSAVFLNACVYDENDQTEDVTGSSEYATEYSTSDYCYHVEQPTSADLDSEATQGTKYSSSDATANLKCGEDEMVYGIYMEFCHWGTYPSICGLSVTCINTTGHVSDVSIGEITYRGGFSTSTCGKTSTGGSYFKATGAQIIAGRYLKDMRLQCGEGFPYVGLACHEAELGISERGYYDSFARSADSNDTTTTTSCDDDKVMTGLKVRYREDANEIALTKAEFYCSDVTLYE